MKKNYILYFLNTLFIAFLAISNNASAQAVMKWTLSTAPIFGINDSGIGVCPNQTYDFATNMKSNAGGDVQGINNNGDIIGSVLVGGQWPNGELQPAYKRIGVWHLMGLLPGSTSDEVFESNDISENGNYITGSISINCCSPQGFLFDVVAGTYQILPMPANATTFHLTGVNNAGTVVGWYVSTLPGDIAHQVPFYTLLNSGLNVTPAQASINDTFIAINNSNVIAVEGERPAIFNLNTNTYTHLQLPYDAVSAHVTGISENGTAVGYYLPSKDAFIYNPTLGDLPLSLRNLLYKNGFSNLYELQKATAISPNSDYICGISYYEDWILKLNSFPFSASYIECQPNIDNLNIGVNHINYTLPFAYGNHPAATLVLVAGLPSGSEFPVGTTTVTHNLVDFDGTILDTCTFTVTIHTTACNAIINNVEPITRVGFGNGLWENVSAANSSVAFEDFTSIPGSIDGVSWPDGTVGPFFLEGNTGGNFTDYFTIFLDWNGSGNFENYERYEMGTITNSTGADGIQAIQSITLPQWMSFSKVIMRVVKTRGAYAVDPCQSTGECQIEQYRMSGGGEPLNTKDFTSSSFKYYPNPTTDVLNVSNEIPINQIAIYNLLGQQMLQMVPERNSVQLNVASLKDGIYFVKARAGESMETFRFIKQ